MPLVPAPMQRKSSAAAKQQVQCINDITMSCILEHYAKIQEIIVQTLV